MNFYFNPSAKKASTPKPTSKPKSRRTWTSTFTPTTWASTSKTNFPISQTAILLALSAAFKNKSTDSRHNNHPLTKNLIKQVWTSFFKATPALATIYNKARSIEQNRRIMWHRCSAAVIANLKRAKQIRCKDLMELRKNISFAQKVVISTFFNNRNQIMKLNKTNIITISKTHSKSTTSTTTTNPSI